MKIAFSKLITTSINLSYQQFFSIENNVLANLYDVWPEIDHLAFADDFSNNAFDLLVIMKFLARDEKAIVISRDKIYKNTRRVVKNAANLNELLYFLQEKGYVNLQFSGVYGRKQFIAMNPQIFSSTISNN